MTCQELENILIQEFSGEEVDPDRRAETKDHLKSCPQCQKNTKEFQALFSSLNNLKETPIPEPDSTYFSTLLQRTQARIKQSDDQTQIIGFKNFIESFLRPLSLKPAYAWSLAVLCGVIILSITSLDEIKFLHQKDIYGQLAHEIGQSIHHSSDLGEDTLLFEGIEDLSDEQLDNIIEMLKIEPQLSNLGRKS